MTRAALWAIGIGLVVVAWFVAAGTPPEEAKEAPFIVAVEVGQTGLGRNIELTIDDVRRAASLTDGSWSAEGNWVVVDLTAAAVLQETAATLSTAELSIGGRTYSASERPKSFARTALAVGIPQSGSLAFELPAGLDAGAAVLTFAENSDTRLDSVVQLTVELADLPAVPEARLRPTEWAAG